MVPSYKIFVILCLRLLTAILLVRAFSLLKFAFSSQLHIASSLPRRILLIHGTLTMILPYLHTRLRSYALSSAWPDAPSSDRRRKAWEVLTSVESTYALLGLASFVTFIWDGRLVIYSCFLPPHPILFVDIGPSPTDFSK